jgi:hypothetical protein
VRSKATLREVIDNAGNELYVEVDLLVIPGDPLISEAVAAAGMRAMIAKKNEIAARREQEYAARRNQGTEKGTDATNTANDAPPGE